MEQMFAIEHLNDQALASLWSEDLPAAATESILAHLESCAECGQRLAAMDSSIEQYRRIVKLVDAHLPDPPRAWADIRVEMERVDLPLRPVPMQPAKAYQGRPIWMSAIAAAILLGLLIWPRGDSMAHAETLLVRAKASAERAHSRKRLHLRVVTGQALFVRPAVLASDGPGNDPLRGQFLTARYDWNDPLSAAAFRGWREQLRQKSDHLSESGEPAQYRLETTTTDNALRDASIVFEGPDLTPVSLRLVFDGGGWVEITAIPEAPATVPAELDRAPARVPAVPELRVTDRQLAERELAVRLAIDALSKNTPVPVTVEVAREGSIIVTPYHLSPEQEHQLSESLSGKEGVLLNSMQRDSGPTGGTVSGGDEEPAIGTGGIIASFAHLLAEDADRFAPAREGLLEPARRAALRDLRTRRTEQLISQLDKLNKQLTATHELAGLGDSPVASCEPAPSLAGLVQAAGSLNRLVTAVYTTGDDHMEASVAWPELSREMGKVRHLARQYECYLKPPAGERR
jgi:hypothetical protein